MKRVVAETQSNKLFQGSCLDQDYDQRGLSQIGQNDLFITTNPVDPKYLAYWQGLGFSLPTMLVAGPYNPKKTLSDLIIENGKLQTQIKRLISNCDARLELFWITELERRLAKCLGITPYCNFDVSIELGLKSNFRLLCQELGIQVPQGAICHNSDELQLFFSSAQRNGAPYLLKKEYGTGGLPCGGSHVISQNDYPRNLSETVIVEKILEDFKEVALHWEITQSGELRIIGFFQQFSRDYGYSGTCSLIDFSNSRREKILKTLKERLFPVLKKRGGVGFFCCDILVHKNEEFWVDLNPRKGAILYIHDMVRRLKKIQFPKANGLFFWHEHFNFEKGHSIVSLCNLLGEMVVPSKNKERLIVLTNPGVYQHGIVDITAVSTISLADAKKFFAIATRKMQV